MEAVSWLKRYSIFIFRGGATGKRSNFYYGGTTSRTPIGELYSAFDGDLEVHESTPYHVHNRGSHEHLQSLGSTLSGGDIFSKDASVQWLLVPAATSGLYELVSAMDGRRLANNGVSVSVLPAAFSGAATEWQLTPSTHGWYFLDHPSTNTRLRRNAGVFELVATNITWNSVKWRFIRPFNPVETVDYFGLGCGNPQFDVETSAVGGSTAEFVLSNSDAFGIGLCVFSTAVLSVPLDVIGMNGCAGHIDFISQGLIGTAGVTDATGRMSVPLVIPPVPGVHLYAQYVFTQAGLNPAELGSTRAADILIK